MQHWASKLVEPVVASERLLKEYVEKMRLKHMK